MRTVRSIPFPVYSRAERLADYAIHALGLAAAAIAVPALVFDHVGNGPVGIGVALYGFGLLAMLAASAVYNTLGIYRYRAFLKDIDQVAIFFMIGGTCSPLTLVAGGGWAIELFAAVWLLVAIGIAIIVVRPDRFERIAIPYYLASGWLVSLAALDALDRWSASGATGLFVLGGIIYTGGIAFHRWHALPYQNALWHMCVLIASCCQYVAIAALVVSPIPVAATH